MSQHKNSYQYTLQIIADILSYENSVDALQFKMVSNAIDWEQFVYVASDYLVLTTCYCRLKHKNLLQFIPDDLEQYLEEITSINENRNRTLLAEIKRISKLFSTHNVNHVFLKGSAFLIKEYYQYLGERMLGDIDILVEENQTKKAYQLLLDDAYTGTKQGISAKYFDHKHLPRLQSDEKLAAVEIHKKVIIQSQKSILDSQNILKEKELINNVYVPSNRHLIYHTILNFQKNDSGYMYGRISFKSIVDLLTLKQRTNFNFESGFNGRYYKNYFSIAGIFFDDFKHFSPKTFTNFIFLQKLKYPWLKKFIDNSLSRIQFFKTILTSRLWFFFKNEQYRKELLNTYKKI